MLFDSSVRRYTKAANDIKKHLPKQVLLSMGYEKDIFGSFAYDFELSQKLIFG